MFYVYFFFSTPILHSSFIFRLSPTGWRQRKAVNYVHKVADDIIAKRKKTRVNKTWYKYIGYITWIIYCTIQEENPDAAKKRYLDFLDILLSAQDDDGQGLTDIEIRHEVDTFLFEGQFWSWNLFNTWMNNYYDLDLLFLKVMTRQHLGYHGQYMSWQNTLKYNRELERKSWMLWMARTTMAEFSGLYIY